MRPHKKYSDMTQPSTKDVRKNLKTYFREYTKSTGIHGIYYLAEERSLFEKIFWSIIVLASLGGCFFMIYEIIKKYEYSPVVVTFAGRSTPLFEIPFPAVTICPESKCLETKFNYSKVYRKYTHEVKEVDNYTEMQYFNYVSLLCNVKTILQILNLRNTTTTVEPNFFDVINELKRSEVIQCYYMEQDCLESLVPVITDQGMCLSFNILDRKDVYREHVLQHDYIQKVTSEPLLYNADLGYPFIADIDTYPRRALMSGVDNSLRIQFVHSHYQTDLLCNNYQQGYRVLLHNPLDIPRLSKSYFHVPLDKTVVAAVDPHLTITSVAVTKFNPVTRNCYLENERPLFYFKIYTQFNCLFECETNYTLNRCGCVNYYMPRTNYTKVCGIKDQDCVNNALRELKLKELESQIEKRSAFEDNCKCKPSCTSLTYSTETTMGDYYMKEFIKIYNSTIIDTDKQYYSSLTVYFKEEQFISIERNELYGVTDFISNFGGLLGLFTGFSLLSCVEIIYFATIRIFYNMRLYGRWFGSTS